MIETRGRLIDTTVKPLADNAELQLAAVALLEEAALKSREGEEEAIARWEAVDAKKKRPWVTWVSGMLLIGLSAWGWSGAGRDLYGHWLSVKAADELMFGEMESIESLKKAISGSQNGKERFLLFGDVSQRTYSEQMKALWDVDPENPACLMEYWIARRAGIQRTVEPPDLDFVTMSERLDPGNSWPIYFAAAQYVNIEFHPYWNPRNDGDALIGWANFAADEGDESLAFLHKASVMPRFENHRIQLSRERASLLPVAYEHGYRWAIQLPERFTPEARLYSVFVLIAAKSREFGGNDNREAFLVLLADFNALIGKWSASDVNSQDLEDSVSLGVEVAVPCLQEAASKFGLENEARELAEIHQRLKACRRTEFLTREPVANDFLVNRSSVMLSDVLDWKVFFPHAKPSVEELKPGRLIDHEFLSLACCLAAWIVFGVSLGLCALFRLRSPLLLRRLSVRIESLLGPVDFAWIIGVGILLPYAFTVAVNRFTSLGGREWGLHGTYGFLPTAQFLGMSLWMLIAPVLMVRWRLGKRAAVLGFGGGKSLVGWFAVTCAAVWIPVSGWIFKMEGEPVVWLVVAIWFGVVPVLWLLVTSLRALCGMGKERLLVRGVIARALLPVYGIAMMLMLFGGLFHWGAERDWFQKDTIMRMDPEFPPMSPFECREARRLRGETRAILGL